MRIDAPLTPTDQKRLQVEWMDKVFHEKKPTSFEKNPYHDFFREIPFLKTHELLKRAQISLDGERVLVASCGDGIDLHYLKKFARSKFHLSDLSENALHAAMAAFPDTDGSVEDNEKLSFPDNHFDYSFIAASLHHLPRPLVGLYELLRVAKKGLIVIEPNDSWLTRVATRLGFATEIEVSGNYVYRFSAHDIERVTKSLFFKFSYQRFFATHRIAKNDVEFAAIKAANRFANTICPSQGNYIVFLIQKVH